LEIYDLDPFLEVSYGTSIIAAVAGTHTGTICIAFDNPAYPQGKGPDFFNPYRE